jgi:hypothetical protein
MRSGISGKSFMRITRVVGISCRTIPCPHTLPASRANWCARCVESPSASAPDLSLHFVDVQTRPDEGLRPRERIDDSDDDRPTLGIGEADTRANQLSNVVLTVRMLLELQPLPLKRPGLLAGEDPATSRSRRA